LKGSGAIPEKEDYKNGKRKIPYSVVLINTLLYPNLSVHHEHEHPQKSPKYDSIDWQYDNSIKTL
jgi:hypothetical protein